MDQTGGKASALSAPIRLLQITDMHLSADPSATLAGVVTDRSCRDVFALAARYTPTPDRLLLTGDLSQDGSKASYGRVKAYAEALSVPARVIPGNHDAPEIMRACFSEGEVLWLDHELLGDWLLVMLNSMVPGSPHGHLSESELDRLDQVLREVPHRHALICLHHQPAPVGARWLDAIGVDNGAELAERLEAHDRVRGVLCGHVHQEVHSRLKHFPLLASPSTCIQFRPGSEGFALDARAPGYRWLTLRADGHIESGVNRLDTVPAELDLASGGY